MRTRAALVLASLGFALSACSATPALPAGPTAAEAEAYVTTQLDAYWFSVGIDYVPHDAGGIRFTSAAQWPAAQVGCLERAGMSARQAGGGVEIDASGPFTSVEVQAIQWRCLRQYAVDPRLPGFLGDDQVAYMYDYFTQRLAPCLAGLGFEVEPAPDPSLYLSGVRSGSAWNPYYSSAGVPLAPSWDSIDRACPPLPAEPYGLFHPGADG